MVQLPVVELHSILLRLKRDETDVTGCEMCGEVKTENGKISEFLFKEDEESSNSGNVLPDGTLYQRGPSSCIVSVGLRFYLCLKDKKSGLEVCNGYHQCNPFPDNCFYDRPVRAVIPGKHGSVVLHYSMFNEGVQASVKVKLLPKGGDDQCSDKHRVYGTIYARYGDYDVKYPGKLSSKYYRSTLLYASSANPVMVDGGIIRLSKRVVGVPESSQVFIEAELWDTYYGVSETRPPDVKGEIPFFPDPKSSGPITLRGSNCCIQVEMEWTRHIYDQYFAYLSSHIFHEESDVEKEES